MNREDIETVACEFADDILSEIGDILSAHEQGLMIRNTRVMLDVDDSLSQFDGDLTSSNQTRLFLTAVSNELKTQLGPQVAVTRRGTQFFIKTVIE